jgi:hypothetical protein
MLLMMAFSDLILITPANHGYIRADPDHACIRGAADHGYIRADPDHTCIRGVADHGCIRNDTDQGFIKADPDPDPDPGLKYLVHVGLILITGETDDMTGDYLALVLNDGYVELR